MYEVLWPLGSGEDLGLTTRGVLLGAFWVRLLCRRKHKAWCERGNQGTGDTYLPSATPSHDGFSFPCSANPQAMCIPLVPRPTDFGRIGRSDHSIPFIDLSCIWDFYQIHPKLRNINNHNITHSLTSQNPTERMFFKSHSFLSHFSLLYDKCCHQCKPPKKSTHNLALCHVSICGLSPSSSSFSYATLPGHAKWSGPHQWKWTENDFKFHSFKCYTNSILSRIHVNAKKTITCTLVATCVILRS